MATFEYVEFPTDAIRLKQTTCEPATKIRTELPEDAQKQPNEPRSTLAFVPQMLLNVPLNTNPRQQQHALLSTRDPLSVPIMTANFRRFVSKVGPIFWLQDRVEEVILWRKGWKCTAVWIAAYAFFCYFPRMALLIPHLVLLGLMLYYHPDPGAPSVQDNIGEGIVDWQGNIQAIQNLMGAFSDAHDAIVPLLRFLLPPSQPKSHSISRPASGTSDAVRPTTDSQPHHPLLIATLVSFLLLLPLLMTELVPLRLLFFLSGAGTVTALHPRIRGPLCNTVLPTLSGTGPGLSVTLSIMPPRLPLSRLSFLRLSPPRTRTFTFTLTFAPRDIYLFFRRLVDDDRLEDSVWRSPQAQVELWENERWVRDTAETKRRKSVVVSFTRDADEEGAKQEDGPSSSTGPVNGFTEGSKPAGSAVGTGGTWSKANLRPNERVGWTRGRDGWSGVGGEVSSNLTFSLSPGWAFIETESWRPDLVASWAVAEDASDVPRTGVRASVCEGADPDGWTYTTDTWTHPRPDGGPSEGWVTRRRRWVRRVYFKGDV